MRVKHRLHDIAARESIGSSRRTEQYGPGAQLVSRPGERPDDLGGRPSTHAVFCLPGPLAQHRQTVVIAGCGQDELFGLFVVDDDQPAQTIVVAGGGVNREQLEQILRAASMIVSDGDIVVIGSQSILGSYGERSCPRRRWRRSKPTSPSLTIRLRQGRSGRRGDRGAVGVPRAARVLWSVLRSRPRRWRPTGLSAPSCVATRAWRDPCGSWTGTTW